MMTEQEINRALDAIPDMLETLNRRRKIMFWYRMNTATTGVANVIAIAEPEPAAEVPAPRPAPPRIGADTVSHAEAARMLGMSERTLEEPQWDFLRFRNGTRKRLYKTAAITQHLEEEARKHRQQQG